MPILFLMLLPTSCASKWYQWLRIWLSRNIRFVGVNVGMSARNRYFQTNYWCITIYQQSFPLVRVSRKRWHDRPWLTKALKISLKHKNELYEEYILHPDGLHKTKCNVYKNCLCKCLLEAETNYFDELFENNKIWLIGHLYFVISDKACINNIRILCLISGKH